MVIDVHTHLGGVKSGGKCLRGWVYVSVDDLLGYMDACGISRAILLPIERVPNVGEDLWQTEKVIEACRKAPSRLVPFCTVDPTTEDIEERIRLYVEEGCMGFGEHRIPILIDHPANMRIYSTCEKLSIPILMEISDAYNFGFDRLMRVVSKFPKLIFIAHGPAWWREISANPDRTKAYPTGRIEPGGLVEKFLAEKENVYADISAASGYNALSRDLEFSRGFVERFSGKLIFGTDFPCIDSEGLQDGPNRRHLFLLQKLNVSNNALDRILSANVSSILNLK